VQSRLEEIAQANGVVFGISADSSFSLDEWAKKEGYSFPLLSDFGKEMIRAYDTMYEVRADHKGVPKRSAFLLDAQGKLVKMEVLEDAKDLPDLDGFINALKSL